jgi:hypothetical protein
MDKNSEISAVWVGTVNWNADVVWFSTLINPTLIYQTNLRPKRKCNQDINDPINPLVTSMKASIMSMRLKYMAINTC